MSSRAVCLAVLVVASLVDAAPAAACDRAASPLEQLPVAVAVADLVVIADVADVHDGAGTLKVVGVLTGRAAVGDALAITGVGDPSAATRCGPAPLVKHGRYLLALWRSRGTRAAYAPVHDQAGYVAHTDATERAWRAAIQRKPPHAAPQPHRSGLVAQLVVDPKPASTGDVDLFVLVRNPTAAAITLDVKSWPRNAMSHCKLVVEHGATRQRLAPTPVPIAAAAIAKYFSKHARRYQPKLRPGESWSFRLPRVTTAAAGWGYKEELGFVYYPVTQAGDHAITATCWNLLGRNSKIGAGTITLPLSL